MIDLDMNDGVAAGYSFSGPTTSVRTIAIGSASSPGVRDERTFDGWLGAVQSLSVDGTATSSLMAGPGFMHAVGSTTDLLSAYESDARRMDEAFTIRPNTKLVFTADFHATASDDACTVPPCQQLPQVHSFSSFHLYQRAADGQELTAASFLLQTDSGFDPTRMNVSYATGDAQWRGNIDLQLSTFGIVPIPQPHTWGLMAVGLAALALRCRRRAAARPLS